MDGSRFDTMAKAAATGVSRRQVLRGLLATVGGATVLQLTGGESEARLSRGCRRAKRALKELCIQNTAGACPVVINFSCVKKSSGMCEGTTFFCATTSGFPCV